MSSGPSHLEATPPQGAPGDLSPDLRALLGREIQARVAGARAAWPGIGAQVDSDFLPQLASKLPSRGAAERLDASTVRESLAAMRVEELWLAWACVHRDPAAIAHFEAAYFGEVDAAVRRFDALPVTLEDVQQRLRQKLYLHDPPSLAGYGGQGDLRGWLRAAVLHLLINIATREARERPTEDGFFDAVLDTSADVEASYLKQACREEFEQAFTLAMTRLSPRERLLLRYAFADRKNVDQIGAVFNVHRATAARWISSARDRLVDETRGELMRSLQVDASDAASIVRAALSRMGTTLMRRLGSA